MMTNNKREPHKINGPSRQHLESVLRQFNHWRKTRKKRERIPAQLWDAAVSLCESYSISSIVNKLRLNYTALKNRVEKKQDNNTQNSNRENEKCTVNFVELLKPASNYSSTQSTSDALIIELQRKDGTHMKISVPQRVAISIEDIVSSFSGGSVL